jgi:NAD(P)-dependent dehydrogenase (short-subunit alcohol dehydrogenase family)
MGDIKKSFFKGKKVFITGAASGIGRATAMALGKQGCRLFLADVNEAGLEETSRTIRTTGGEVCASRALRVDDYQAMRSFAEDLHRQYGAMDMVLNVAGVALFAQIEDMSHDDWQRVIHVNLWGVIHGLECFVPEMIRAGRGGHLVLVSSTAGLMGLPWHAAYAASKHALVGIAEVLRYDLRKHKIGVSVICPGAVDTGLVRTAEIHTRNLQDTEKLRAGFRKIAIAPEKVAQMIVQAIRKRQFMVITSWDIKLFYWTKKYCFPVYHLVMLAISRLMDRTLQRKSPEAKRYDG